MLIKLRYEKKAKIAGYCFIIPAVLYMAVFIGYPIIYNIILGFQDVDVMTVQQNVHNFVGLRNYRDLFSEGLLQITMKNTFVFTILSLLFQFTIGFLLALFFNKQFLLAKPIRGIMLVNWMMPMTVTALVFQFMYNQENGVLNEIGIFLRLIDKPVPWLIDSKFAMWSAIITNTFAGIPFNMILLTTGLSGISKVFYESASIDGAGSFKQFMKITLPLLKPAIVSVLILGFIYTFKVFDLIFVMTNGGPVNATEVMSTYAYNLSFRQYNFSKGAAVANILFLCLFVVGLFYTRLIKKDEVVE